MRKDSEGYVTSQVYVNLILFVVNKVDRSCYAAGIICLVASSTNGLKFIKVGDIDKG